MYHLYKDLSYKIVFWGSIENKVYGKYYSEKIYYNQQ